MIDAAHRDAGPVGLFVYFTAIGKRGIEGRWSLARNAETADQEPKWQGAARYIETYQNG